MKIHFPAMRPLAVILLPLLARLAIGAASSKKGVCPQPEDLYPCSCSIYSGYTLQITCATGTVNEIQEALRRNKQYLLEQDVYEVSLRNLKTERLPSLLFSGLRMIQVTIGGCDLKGLADCDGAPPFVGIHDLVRVQIFKSIKGDNEMPTLHLEHLEGLRDLSLWGNNIPELGNDWFRNGPYNLESLTIHGCGVRTIGDRAFETLTNLKNLYLRENPFQTFPRSMLPKPAKSLVFLALSENNLSILPEDTFAEMPSLHHVILSSNPMGRLPEATWSSIWPQLRQIELSACPLECDSHMEWIFKMKKPWGLSGWCMSPEELKYKKLSDLISENQKSTA